MNRRIHWICIIVFGVSVSDSFAQHHGGNINSGHRMDMARRSVTPSVQTYRPVYVPPIQFRPPIVPPVIHTPTFVSPFTEVVNTTGFHRHTHFYYPGRYYGGFYPTPQPVSYVPYPTAPVMTVLPVLSDSKLPEKKPSTPAARLRSLEYQIRGDEKLRSQQWSEARALYAKALEVAPDRAEARMRLAFSYTSILRFQQAVLQIKFAIGQNPQLAKTGQKLETIFGPGSQLARSSIIAKIREWVNEDSDNSDRLFLLGVMLHFNGDPESRDYLEAAKRAAIGVNDQHIVPFLKNSTPDVVKGPLQKFDGLPKLNDVPVPVLPKFDDLRFPSYSRIPNSTSQELISPVLLR